MILKMLTCVSVLVIKNNIIYIYKNLGSDSTYLRTAGFISNTHLPMLGINTNPRFRESIFANACVDSE